jgi:hypothetical protein
MMARQAREHGESSVLPSATSASLLAVALLPPYLGPVQKADPRGIKRDALPILCFGLVWLAANSSSS